MPEAEYQVVGEGKQGCRKAGSEVKKSALLRIGVALIRDMSVPALHRDLAGVAPLEPGWPKRASSHSLQY